ncbi:MAG: hypothetical protein KC517_09400 [Bacteroidetes bacterium]|nr:hypothetical protein [Bacteroidota bacterium]
MDLELRDEFAVKALSHSTCEFNSPELLAKRVYRIADAMVEARKTPNTKDDSQNVNQHLKDSISELVFITQCVTNGSLMKNKNKLYQLLNAVLAKLKSI